MELFKVFGSIFIKNKEADRALAQTASQANSLGSKFGKVAKTVGVASAVVGGAAIAAGGAIFEFAKKQAVAADDIDEGAAKIGISTKAYQEWSHVLSISGSDISVLQKSMKTLSVAAVNADKGNEALSMTFQKLGVDIYDSQHKLKSQEDLLNEVTNALAAMPANADRAALATQLLGKGAVELGPTLVAGVDGIAAMKQEANDLGMVIDDQTIKSSAALADQLDTMNQALSKLALAAFAPMLPMINDFAKLMTDAIPPIIDLVSPIIKQLTPALQELMAQIMPVLSKVFEAFAPVLTSVTSIIMQLTSSAIIPLLNALLPVITSLFNSLIPAFDKILQVIMPLIPPLLEIIQMILPALMQVINVLITSALDFLIEVFKQLQPVIVLVLDILKQLIQAGVLELIKALLPLISSVLPTLTELIKLVLPVLTGFLTILLKIADYVIPIVVESLTSLVRIISGSVSQCFKLLGDVIQATADIAKDAFSGLMGFIRPIINGVINAINTVIKGLNRISIKLPDWMPGVGGEHFGINIPLIPRLAKGGLIGKTGLAMVGEQGPELLRLNRGAEVMPLSQARDQILINKGAFAGAFIMDDYGVDKLLDRLVQRLKIYGIKP